MTLAIGIGVGITFPRTQGGGVPDFITIDGILAQLLLGQDGQPLTGQDGQYLYGRAA